MAAWLPASAGAAPVLRSAAVEVTFTAPAACDVALTTDITDLDEVEHRLELIEGAAAEFVGIDGGTVVGAPRDVGRTRSLLVTPDRLGGAYTLRYRVTQSASHAYRCPIWLPTIPADGRSRNVRLAVTVPDGTTAAATMPAFAWSGPHGTAMLAHLPAVVIVPFAGAGEPRPRDISRLMDLSAMATLAAGTAWWLRRRKGRH